MRTPPSGVGGALVPVRVRRVAGRFEGALGPPLLDPDVRLGPCPLPCPRRHVGAHDRSRVAGLGCRRLTVLSRGSGPPADDPGSGRSGAPAPRRLSAPLAVRPPPAVWSTLRARSGSSSAAVGSSGPARGRRVSARFAPRTPRSLGREAGTPAGSRPRPLGAGMRHGLGVQPARRRHPGGGEHSPCDQLAGDAGDVCGPVSVRLREFSGLIVVFL